MGVGIIVSLEVRTNPVNSSHSCEEMIKLSTLIQVDWKRGGDSIAEPLIMQRHNRRVCSVVIKLRNLVCFLKHGQGKWEGRSKAGSLAPAEPRSRMRVWALACMSVDTGPSLYANIGSLSSITPITHNKQTVLGTGRLHDMSPCAHGCAPLANLHTVFAQTKLPTEY